LKISFFNLEAEHHQVCAESGFYLRALLRVGRASDERQLPESLSFVPVVTARRRQAGRPGKGLAIIQRCVRCGFTRANRLAVDTAQEDDIGAVCDLMPQVIS
jgi:hypothetical protein